MAYGATLEIRNAGKTKKVSIDKFFVLHEQSITRETILEPGEILTAVFLPPAKPGLRSSYRKVRARESWDFSLAGVALALRFQERTVAGTSIVLSGAAPIPWRCSDSEKILAGQPLDGKVIARAAAAAMRAARPLRYNDYEIELFKGVLAEELAAYAS